MRAPLALNRYAANACGCAVPMRERLWPPNALDERRNRDKTYRAFRDAVDSFPPRSKDEEEEEIISADLIRQLPDNFFNPFKVPP